MDEKKSQRSLFIGIGGDSKTVESKKVGIEGQKHAGRPMVDMRRVQDPMVKITRINEGTGCAGIKGDVR